MSELARVREARPAGGAGNDTVSGWSDSDLCVVFLCRPIILTVAKCWDPSPQGYFTLPRSECCRTQTPWSP